MYTIYLDGKPLYAPAMYGTAYKVLAPKLMLDINASGHCSFTLPPGNAMHGAIRRRKSIITVNQDGQEIFRGRVLDDSTDTYKQKVVYAEGIRSYLNDSQAAPYTYSGTPRALLKKLIDEHNAQIEPEKRFTLGRVTIDRADEAMICENVAYWETYREIEEKLLGAYGGYLKARYEDGQLYIDWLKEYGEKNAQPIRFAVNLLDLADKNDSGGMFTILRPLGASEIGEDGEYGAALAIASVNGGKDYIEDEEAISKYGRIWKTHTWAYEEDPAKLLKKAQEYLKIGAELRTITLRAIDMHFIDGSAQAIHVGDTVHIVSQPHGIDIEKVCCKIDIDLANPENTTYTFGEAPRTLTENIVQQEKDVSELSASSGGGRGGASKKKEMDGILRWAKIQVDESNANIKLVAGEANSLNNRLSKAEIEIDGINAQILLKASQEEVTDLGMRMSAAGIDIRGDIANIKLLATQETVNDLGHDLSEAWIEINGLNSEIELKADRIELNGYVTASQFSSLQSDIAQLKSGTVQASHLYTQNLTATNTVRLAGHTCEWLEKTVISGGSCSFESTQKTVVDASGNAIGYVYVPTKVTFTPSGRSTIKYLGR